LKLINKKNALETPTHLAFIVKTRIPTCYANIIFEHINRYFHCFCNFNFKNRAKVAIFFNSTKFSKNIYYKIVFYKYIVYICGIHYDLQQFITEGDMELKGTVGLFLLFFCGQMSAQMADKNYTPQSGQAGKDIIWVPTPQEFVEIAFDMANVTSRDYFIDLGSGDGRLVIAAAKRGAKALGIEYNPDLVEYSRRIAIEEGVSKRAIFKKADIFESDFSKATVLYLYLGYHLNQMMRPKILDMKPGTRILSNSYNLNDWKPDQTKEFEGNEEWDWKAIFLWIVPAKVDGTWKLKDGQISFTQEFQHITGTLTMGNVDTELTGKLNGDKIRFNAGGMEYTGTVSGNKITGKRTGGGSWKATRK